MEVPVFWYNFGVSHFIYQTEAIILGEVPIGESDRFYFLLTRDLGFIVGQATGVRILKSKLRFHLSLFSSVEVELVRGKNLWRIVNAYPKESDQFYLNVHAPLFARLTLLIRRLVHGEEENQKLFEEINSVRDLLNENRLSQGEEENLEIVAVARILSALGYLHAEKYPNIISGPFDRFVIARAAPFKSELVKNINAALKESHL